jgi:hypothetical protein
MMGMKQLKRAGRDGAVKVERVDASNTRNGGEGELIRISTMQQIVCTEWQARRLLAMLSTILEVPLSPAAAKHIELG